jgi:hypothetical protein
MYLDEDSLYLDTAGEPVWFSAGMQASNMERVWLQHDLQAAALLGVSRVQETRKLCWETGTSLVLIQMRSN